MTTHQGTMPAPHGLFGLPSTRTGRVSTLSFLFALVLIVLLATVPGFKTISIGSLNVVAMITFLVVATALVAGAIALIRDKERSWIVWLSTALPALLVGFELIEVLFGG